jgi:hypothetical protein
MESLGLDIGGANTKYATNTGKFGVIYHPLWKGDVFDVLVRISEEHPHEKVGVVMTGELADAFRSRSEGVLHIAKVCMEVFDDVLFLSVDGSLHCFEDLIKEPLKFAASNWVASAIFVGHHYQDCIFADMGSTTTDIIPIVGGVPVAGKTDLERLMNRELVYTGFLRTNVATIISAVEINGKEIPLSKEYFATTGDVYSLLGLTEDIDYPWETADGRGKDIMSCAKRLARVVCSDLDEISLEDVVEIAHQIRDAQISEVSEAMRVKADECGVCKVVGAGVGEEILKDASAMAGLSFVSVSAKYGALSSVFPSYALSLMVD